MYSRAKRLRLEAEEHALSLQNAFHVELMKLPKSVRAMSLREFSEQYGEVREGRERGREGGQEESRVGGRSSTARILAMRMSLHPPFSPSLPPYLRTFAP